MPYNPQTMNLNAAQANAAASKDSYGASGPTIIDAPAGVKFFALKKDMIGQDVYLNIIPWGIESDKHMGVHNGTAQIGQGEIFAEMWTHRVEGVVKGNSLCLQRMYGTRCPFCEASKNSGAGEAKASHRMALWVQHVDAQGNPVGGDPTPKLFITSYATFGKELLDSAEVQGRRMGLPGSIPFADPSINGKIVTFRVENKSGGGFDFLNCVQFGFLPRRAPIAQNILDTIPAIDKFLHIPTDKEIAEALYGADNTPAAPAAPAYQQAAPATPAAQNYGAPAQGYGQGGFQQAAPAAAPNYGAPAAPAGQSQGFGAPGTAAPAAPTGAPAYDPNATGYPEPTF